MNASKPNSKSLARSFACNAVQSRGRDVIRLATMGAGACTASTSTSTSTSTSINLIVFDFDLTILNIHSWSDRIAPKDVPFRNLEQDVADLEFFRAFVGRALDNGIKVAIASFGKYEVIQGYMDRAVGPAGHISLFYQLNLSA